MRSIIVNVSLFVASLLALMFPMVAAQAIPSTTSFVGPSSTGSCGGKPSKSEDGPASAVELNDSFDACMADALAYARKGKVGVGATYKLIKSESGRDSLQRGGVRAFAASNYILDVDFPVDFPGGLFPLSINFTFKGQVSASVTPQSARFAEVATSNLEARVSVSGKKSTVSGVTAREELRYGAAASDGGSLNDGQIINEKLVTDTILVDLDFPIMVQLTANTTVAAIGTTNTIAEATGDAANSLSFATTGPVFNLPEGFTVNSPDANIFDNRWIDPDAVSPVPAPAPSTSLLVAGALSLFAAARRRG